jgi:hypothetical protein
MKTDSISMHCNNARCKDLDKREYLQRTSSIITQRRCQTPPFASFAKAGKSKKTGVLVRACGLSIES